VLLTDSEIDALLTEPKPEVGARALLASLQSSKTGHRRASISVEGDSGSTFLLSLRQSELDPENFSVILTYW